MSRFICSTHSRSGAVNGDEIDNENQKFELSDMLQNLPNLNNPVKVDILPPELLETILKLLNYRNICQARQVCRRWKEIIDNGDLIIKASGKIFEHHATECI